MEHRPALPAVTAIYLLAARKGHDDALDYVMAEIEARN